MEFNSWAPNLNSALSLPWLTGCAKAVVASAKSKNLKAGLDASVSPLAIRSHTYKEMDFHRVQRAQVFIVGTQTSAICRNGNRDLNRPVVAFSDA